MVIVPVFEALRIFVDLIGDAVALGASFGDVGSGILQTDVDEVPSRGSGIFDAKFRIR
jgi:hypothetical protein